MRFVKKAISMSLAAALLFLEAGIPVYAQDVEAVITENQEEITDEDVESEYSDPQEDNVGEGQNEAEQVQEDQETDLVAEESEDVVDESIRVNDSVENELSESEDAVRFLEEAEHVAEEAEHVVEEENMEQKAGGLSLSVQFPTDIKCGVPVTFTMNASGGTGQYQYRIAALLREEDSELVSVYDVSYGNNSAYQENNTFQFTFFASGTYYLRFSTMDMGRKPYQTVTTDLYEYPITIQDAAYPSVEQIVDRVSAECLKNCSTDYDKALWLHDWIINNAEYDNSYTYCSAEGVLARKIGTCESYHRAYVLLLDKVGIQTGRITGNGHVWTAVKIDGKWYQVDTTWDGGQAQKGTDYQYLFFGLTDYIIGLVHTDHKAAVSGYESTALENNYFIKTGKVKQWSVPFEDSIKKNLNEGKGEFIVPVTSSMPNNYKNIIYNLAAYQLSNQDWDGKKISVSYKNNSLIIKPDNGVDELLSIRVVPLKKIYEKGEAIDSAGLKVIAYYLGGIKTRVLDKSEYRIGGFQTTDVGKHTATVTYNGETDSFTYDVKEKPNTGGGENTGDGSGETTQPEKPKPVGISYRTHVQSIGWQGFAANGVMSGTIGKAKRLEGIEIKLDTTANLGVQYTTHCQSYGWLPWSSNGETNGTTGEAKRLEAIKIQLAGADKDQYDIYYRVHAQTYGWLNWVKNGEAAGTAGYAKRLEGIQIVVVKKGENFDRNMQGITSNEHRGFIAGTGGEPEVGGAESANTAYRTHVQTYGWQGFKYNGQMSGTTGKAKRLEGIELRLTNQQYDGGVEYRTHIQKIGWQGWKANGEMSGTSGEAKRLEAIEIRLTGTMEKQYDIYYRVHAQKFGWMGWAKNGESAGTAGHAYRLEGIEIKLVPKGSPAPGSTERPFVQK